MTDKKIFTWVQLGLLLLVCWHGFCWLGWECRVGGWGPVCHISVLHVQVRYLPIICFNPKTHFSSKPNVCHAGERVSPPRPNRIKSRLDPAGRFIKMDGTEANLLLEGRAWKWMGLAAHQRNKRNESRNRLSANSIRDQVTPRRPFIMMMLGSEILQSRSP